MAGTAALIVAAGRGTRLGAEGGIPKQYLPLAGRAILAHAAMAFREHPDVDAVRTVIHVNDGDAYRAAVSGIELMPPVTGGATRQESVRRGLESLVEMSPDRVLIHDAARPLVGAAVISRVIAALDRHAGAVPALPVADSLKRAKDDLITESVPRDGLWRAQTPQGFRFADILEAHRRVGADGDAGFTDDAAVFAAAGFAVTVVAGDEDNFKVTTAADLAQARRHLAGATEHRTGQGFDIHAFDRARPGPVRLCGVDIPYPTALAGHSDADSGLHALTDALLATIAAGDIGLHFPPSDPRWKNVDSAVFLRHAGDLVSAAGGRITMLDVTILCETPKVGPHRDAMRARIAAILGLDEDRVSVKATTLEGLGALGRGEGIAAQAVATVAFAGPP